MNKNFKIFFSLVWLFELLFFVLTPIVATAALTPEQMDEAEGYYGKDSIKLNVPIGNTVRVEGLGEYVQLWYNFVIGGVGIMATVIIMWGGFKWLTSHGNSAMIGDAKDRIFAAITGLVIAFLSFTIFQIINPNLLNLTLPELNTVDVVVTHNQTYGNVVGSEDNVPFDGASVGQATGDEEAVRQRLRAAGIAINAGPERTQVGGYQEATIENLEFMAGDYYDRYGGDDPLVNTGGSEGDGHSSTGCHPRGCAIDIRSRDEEREYDDVNNYMLDEVIGGGDPSGSFTESTVNAQGETITTTYQYYDVTYNDQPIRVIDERNRPGAAHWHISWQQ